MTTATHPLALRAHELSATAARRHLALLAALPVPFAETRARVTRASCHTLTDQFGPERAVLRAPRTALPGVDLVQLHAVTTHRTTYLGRTLAEVIEAEEEEWERRLTRAGALRVGALRRLLDAERLRAATVEHVAESLAIFEVLPVRPADFDVMLTEVAHASGFAPVNGGYRLLDGVRPVGPLITDGDLGVGRSRAELEVSAADAADEFAEVWELILALLWSSSGSDSIDSLLDDASALGVELDDFGPATADDIDLDDPDEVLRFDFRRAAHMHAQVAPAREAARQLARGKRERAAERERRQQRWAEHQAKQAREREIRRRISKAEIRDLRFDRDATPNHDHSGGDKPGPKSDKGDDGWSL